MYIKNDDAKNIYFLSKGAAGFVHLNAPNPNVIFVDEGEGNNFRWLELFLQYVIEIKTY